MANFSKKLKGKEVGSASVYAEPHSMTGAAGVDLKNTGYGGKLPRKIDELNPSIGNISKGPVAEPKTSGIKMRGTGAATKGVTSRGPMG